MKSFTNPLGLASLALALLGLAPGLRAQDETFFAGFGGGGSGDVTSPVKFVKNPPPMPWIFQTMWGSTATDRGSILAKSNYWAAFGQTAVPSSLAVGRYDIHDLVFSAPPGVTSTTVWVRVHASGGYSGSIGSSIGAWGATASIKVIVGFTQYDEGVANHSYSAASGLTEHDASGLLAGWDMSSGIDITAGPFIVPTNTPVLLRLEAGASTASSNNSFGYATYKYSLGHAASFAGSGGQPLFVLEPGVTANSVAGGIVDNLWSPSDELQLTTDNADVLVGESFSLYTWNGPPGRPVALFVTELAGTPVLALVDVPVLLDDDGEWTLGPAPHLPALAGLDLGLKSVTKEVVGPLIWSDQLLLSFE